MKNEKRYKVIALSVGGRGKKIFNSGDEVSASNFPDGNAEELVKSDFLKPIGVSDTDEPEQGTDLGEGQPEVGKTPIGKIAVKKLKTDLAAAGIEFEATATKEELYDLWVKLD